MSSRKVIVNPSGAVTSDPSFKGKSTSDVCDSSIDQLSRGASDMSVNSGLDDGWKEYTKKSKNRNRNNASKQWGPQHNAWGRSDTVPKLGARTNDGLRRASGQTVPALSYSSRVHVAVPPVVPPPLKDGWQWSTRAASSHSSDDIVVLNENTQADLTYDQASKVDEVDDSDEESDGIDDSDDELLSDDCDSDDSQKSHETRKKNKWFVEFFSCLDNLTVEQVSEPTRGWHCPACKGGPGAIDWYYGLQPLITHAKTKKSKRVKLHREFAELLDEELRRRGASAVSAGEMFGKWKGLKERTDKEIVWPPMVVIRNTQLDRDENERWIGMGNQELLDYFSEYSAVKARHSYGPQGHRGMSVLIFEASAVGYIEAERLSKHFEDNGRDRNAWETKRVLFYPGGKRQLYGYMAEKQDMEIFNQHCQGKSKLKYEMQSYQEMVVNQLKQMSEDNQQLIWLKYKVDKEQRSKKALEEHFGIMTEKLRKTSEENRIVKERTKKHHQKIQEEMDSQEKFYRDYIDNILQHERPNVTQSTVNVSSVEERLRRSEDIEKLIQHDEEREEFVKKRDKLIKQFDEELKKLMEEYTPIESKRGDGQTGN